MVITKLICKSSTEATMDRLLIITASSTHLHMFLIIQIIIQTLWYVPNLGRLVFDWSMLSIIKERYLALFSVAFFACL